ncbi:hypothetical protein KDU71_22215 [Carboxylicivirga sediminis]|uniref:Uncharacterized protein n=1 Tax=Carboxylicivirga sediminis TaxID=2006564 RepID=A0A941J393_9BACT|nr:hypothetical protein [Carboxylicivirga sediminis]MBR8538302.1 hypothetical protein [Carboxylicivirga sediminis]
MKRIVFLLLSFILFIGADAQIYSDKVVGKNSAQELDSLSVAEYPYLLPIWGEKVTQLGFDLPYSAGVSVQYVWQESDLLIDNLQVGFNNGNLFALDEIVRFKNATAITNGVNVRPDFWLFPFLNIYGIFAKSENQTAVDFGVYAPGSFEVVDGTLNWEWESVMEAGTTARFDATSIGFGVTPTIGVGGGFMAFDMNFTWTDIPELDKPAKIFIFGPRLGKTFQFKRPQQNIALWVGGFRVKMNSGTSGSLLVNDLIPGFDELVTSGLEKVDQRQQEVDEWWDSLSDIQKKRPENIRNYTTSKAKLGVAGAALDAASRAESVEYNLDKRPENMWNFIVGSQFQYNKNMMVRAEMGFLGARTQLIVGLQYRFGL